MIYVTKEEMEEPRLASELLQWVTSKLEEIGQIEGSRPAFTRLKGGLKELVEEIYPLALWGDTLPNSHEVILEPKIGSQNYDAVVTDTLGRFAPYHVEVTQAHKGDQEFLRRLHLERERWSPGPSLPLKRNGTQSTELKVVVRRILTSLDQVVSDTEGLIEEAILRKTKKVYPESTHLVIFFEDMVVSAHEGIENKLCAVIERAVDKQACSFVSIYLIGSTQRVNVVWHVVSLPVEVIHY